MNFSLKLFLLYLCWSFKFSQSPFSSIQKTLQYYFDNLNENISLTEQCLLR